MLTLPEVNGLIDHKSRTMNRLDEILNRCCMNLTYRVYIMPSILLALYCSFCQSLRTFKSRGLLKSQELSLIKAASELDSPLGPACCKSSGRDAVSLRLVAGLTRASEHC